MRKGRKKRNIGMTDGAKNAMNDYGKQVFDHLDSNFRDPNDPHNITVQSLSTHFAKEGFKKGYEYGKREERAKVFNIQERIKDFREEMRPICKKYGIDFLNSYVNMEYSSGTIKFEEKFVGSFHDMMEAYVNEMEALLSQKCEELDLSVRTRNLLKANGIDSIADICRLKKTDWLKFRNGGKKSLTELDDFLEKHGLEWGMEV